jgi:hypothetical protein
VLTRPELIGESCRRRGDQRRRIMRMKRFAAIASTIGAIGAVAAPAASADPPNDQVTGHASAPWDISVGAHSGPLGENPQGHLRIVLEDGTVWSGEVSCMTVLGNRAAVGINAANAPGGGAAVVIEDNEGTGLPDRDNITYGAPATPAFCDLIFPITVFPFDGDFRVRDALP